MAEQFAFDKEAIDRAAIWWEGRVYSCPRPGRHHDVIRQMSNLGLGPECMHHQGFVTDSGRFVDRAEGMKIAIRAEQLIEPRDANNIPFTRKSGQLFSEDMW